MQRGEQPKELPKIDVYTCKICNASVKFIKKRNRLIQMFQVGGGIGGFSHKALLCATNFVMLFSMSRSFRERYRFKDPFKVKTS